jgi:hypothetical protein
MASHDAELIEDIPLPIEFVSCAKQMKKYIVYRCCGGRY